MLLTAVARRGRRISRALLKSTTGERRRYWTLVVLESTKTEDYIYIHLS